MGQVNVRYDYAWAMEGVARAADKRRYKRRHAVSAAELEVAKGECLACTILDLSLGGAKLMFRQSAPRLAKGKIVALSALPIGMRWGRITWISGRSAGLEFLDGDPATMAPKPGRSDAEFFRARAEILRRLAKNTPSATAAAKLLSSAKGFEEVARGLEQAPPEANPGA